MRKLSSVLLVYLCGAVTAEAAIFQQCKEGITEFSVRFSMRLFVSCFSLGRSYFAASKKVFKKCPNFSVHLHTRVVTFILLFPGR